MQSEGEDRGAAISAFIITNEARRLVVWPQRLTRFAVQGRLHNSQHEGVEHEGGLCLQGCCLDYT